MRRLLPQIILGFASVLAIASASAEECLLNYTFTRGSNRPAEEKGALHANILSHGNGKLFGISPKEEQLYILLKQEEEMLPSTWEEAEVSEHCASFSIMPAEGQSVTIKRLTFSVGAASVRLSGRLHAVLAGQSGGKDFIIPVAFTRQGEEAGEAYPVRPGDQRDTLHGRGEADLSSLASPLDAPVTFRLYFYLTDADLAKIPSGTNYSIRVDDLQLTGDVNQP